MKSKSNYFQQVNAATELSPEYSTTGTTSLGGTGYSQLLTMVILTCAASWGSLGLLFGLRGS